MARRNPLFILAQKYDIWPIRITRPRMCAEEAKGVPSPFRQKDFKHSQLETAEIQSSRHLLLRHCWALGLTILPILTIHLRYLTVRPLNLRSRTATLPLTMTADRSGNTHRWASITHRCTLSEQTVLLYLLVGHHAVLRSA